MSELGSLERLKLSFGATEGARKLALLEELKNRSFRSASEIERFHEALCFLRAYPDNAELATLAASLLERFHERRDVERHRAALRDTGISGTSITYTFFAPTAVWLAERFADRLSIDWKAWDEKERLRRWLPVLAHEGEQPGLEEDEASEEEWLSRLKGPGETDAAFLIRRVRSLSMSEPLREIMYEDLAIPIELRPGPDTPSRSRAYYGGSSVVHQTRPLVARRPNLKEALLRPPLSVTEVGRAEGEKLIDLARAAMVTRLRDLDAFAYGDPDDVRMVDSGDGLELVCIGAVPERRLLLEAVYGFLILRNGVPIGYALTSALFGSSEVAYNVFETFRGAEAAWVYGRVLGAVRHLFGSDAFTVYPYQLGHENEEGLKSGAFWFYQKLGFLPRDPDVLRLMKRETEKTRARARHRSSLRTLKVLSSKNVYYYLGLPRDEVIGIVPLSNVGLAVTRLLSERFGSNREEARLVCAREAREILGVSEVPFISESERLAWERWSPLLLALPGIAAWNASEKAALVDVVRAKGGRRESDFSERFDGHPALRRAVVSLAKKKTLRRTGGACDAAFKQLPW